MKTGYKIAIGLVAGLVLIFAGYKSFAGTGTSENQTGEMLPDGVELGSGTIMSNGVNVPVYVKTDPVSGIKVEGVVENGVFIPIPQVTKQRRATQTV